MWRVTRDGLNDRPRRERWSREASTQSLLDADPSGCVARRCALSSVWYRLSFTVLLLLLALLLQEAPSVAASRTACPSDTLYVPGYECPCTTSTDGWTAHCYEITPPPPKTPASNRSRTTSDIDEVRSSLGASIATADAAAAAVSGRSDADGENGRDLNHQQEKKNEEEGEHEDNVNRSAATWQPQFPSGISTATTREDSGAIIGDGAVGGGVKPALAAATESVGIAPQQRYASSSLLTNALAEIGREEKLPVVAAAAAELTTTISPSQPPPPPPPPSAVPAAVVVTNAMATTPHDAVSQDTSNTPARDLQRGHVRKREERVAQSRLQATVTTQQREHLVKMQVHSGRSRRAARPHFSIASSRLLNPAFSLVYMDNTLEVICTSTGMEVPGILEHLNVPAEAFRFYGCPIPLNVTYADILRVHDRVISKLHIERPTLSSSVLEKRPFASLKGNLTALKISDSSETGMPLISFEEGFFADFVNLSWLSLVTNKITDLRFLQVLPSLMNLSLRGNPLQRINAATFAGLTNITWLQLVDCKITEISPNAFEDLKNLQTLNLARNMLQSLPVKLFHKNHLLETLSIDFNHLEDGIPEDLLKSLSKLKNLTCRRCFLRSLPKTFFYGSQSLETLRLENNRIEHLPEEVFSRSQNLTILSLENNDLVSLENGTFRKLLKLRQLKLKENNLTALPHGLFDTNVGLEEIDLTGNFINSLPRLLLQNLFSLRTLRLARNKLTTLPGPTFTGSLPSISHIDLSNNIMTAMPALLTAGMPKLEKLNLSKNNIRHLQMIPFYSAKLEVDLRDNPIETVTVLTKTDASFDDKASSYFDAKAMNADRVYRLNTKDLICDCHLLDFYLYVTKRNNPELGRFSWNSLACKSGVDFLSMQGHNFTCKVADCPSLCQCESSPFNQSVSVDCANAGLESMPPLPLNVTYVDVQYNSFVEVPDFSRYRLLRAVNLSSNLIRDISPILKLSLPELKMVSLRNNLIADMDPQVVEGKEVAFDLELSGNLLSCNCDTVAMRNFLIQNAKSIVDSTNVTCSEAIRVGEDSFKNRLFDIDYDSYCPEGIIAQRRRTKIYVAISCTLGALLVLITLLYYKNRRRIIVYLYNKYYFIYVVFFEKDELEKDKQYDAFLSYSEHDNDVMKAMLNELERIDPVTGEKEFKLCVHGRDFLPGYSIVYNVLRAVQNSRRTILVLSQKFVESNWFDVEFKTAFNEMVTKDKSHRLIIVVKGDLPPLENLDKDLRYIVTTNTYIEWGSSSFWDNVRYAMPHKKTRRHRGGHANSSMTRNENDHLMHVLNHHPKPSDSDVTRLEEQLENERNRLRTAVAQAAAAAEAAAPARTTSDKMSPLSQNGSSSSSKATRSILNSHDRVNGGSGGSNNNNNRNNNKSITNNNSSSSISESEHPTRPAIGHINCAFEPVSTEDISVHCDSVREDSFRNGTRAGADVANKPVVVVVPGSGNEVQKNASKAVSARHRPADAAVQRPPRRKDKDSSDA